MLHLQAGQVMPGRVGPVQRVAHTDHSGHELGATVRVAPGFVDHRRCDSREFGRTQLIPQPVSDALTDQQVALAVHTAQGVACRRDVQLVLRLRLLEITQFDEHRHNAVEVDRQRRGSLRNRLFERRDLTRNPVSSFGQPKELVVLRYLMRWVIAQFATQTTQFTVICRAGALRLFTAGHVDARRPQRGREVSPTAPRTPVDLLGEPHVAEHLGRVQEVAGTDPATPGVLADHKGLGIANVCRRFENHREPSVPATVQADDLTTLECGQIFDRALLRGHP